MTFLISSSSTFSSWSVVIWPFSRLARASLSGAGRSRLPTSSARKGAVVFCMGVTPSDWALYRFDAAPREGCSSLRSRRYGSRAGQGRCECGAVALIDDAAAVEDDGPIGKPENLARLLLDDDGRETLFANDVAGHAE